MHRNAGAKPQTKLKPEPQKSKPETHAHLRMRVRPARKDPPFLRGLLEMRIRTIPVMQPQILTSGDFDYHVDLVGDEPSPPPPEPPAATTARESEGGLIAPREPGKFFPLPHRPGKFNSFGQKGQGTKARAAIEALNDARKEKAEREARDAEAAFEEEASKHWYPPRDRSVSLSTVGS